MNGFGRCSFCMRFIAFICPRPRKFERAETLIPFGGYEKLLSRRYEEAIAAFLAERKLRMD